MATSVPGDEGVKDKRKARHTCWTLNNWTEAELERLRDYAQKECRYVCWSQEICPTTGTPHLQGYTAWENPRSLEKFRLTISERLHYEPYTQGSAQQNRAYCLGLVEKKGFKQNPTFEEVGELPVQGERTDWATARSHLQAGQSVVSVIDAQPQLLPAIRSLERYRTLATSKPLHRDVKVIVFIGPSGTGKTRGAYNISPDLYSKPEGHWWDGYAGEKTILLDDYYGDIPYSQFLKVLDRYPLSLPQKGTFIYAQWDTVIITSNQHPRNWYPQGFTDALERRITHLEIQYNPDAPCKQEEVSSPQARSRASSSHVWAQESTSPGADGVLRDPV